MNNVSRMRVAAVCFALVGCMGIANTFENLNSGRFKVDLLLGELWLGWRLWRGDLTVVVWASRAAVFTLWLSLILLFFLDFPAEGARGLSALDRWLHSESAPLRSFVLCLLSGVQFLMLRSERLRMPPRDRSHTTVV